MVNCFKKITQAGLKFRKYKTSTVNQGLDLQNRSFYPLAYYKNIIFAIDE